MIPYASLPAGAIVLGVVTILLGRWRGRDLKRSVGEARTAALVAGIGTVLAVAAYTLGQQAEATGWRNLGGATLLVTPLAGALALRVRHGLSFSRSLLTGGLVSVSLFVWLLLALRGPGGGWGAVEVIVAAMSSIVAFTSGLCAGAWSRRVAGLWLAAAVTGLSGACGGTPAEPEALIVIEVRDGDSGEPIPARVELVDGEGAFWVAEDALQIAGDCGMLPLHNWFPAVGRLQVDVRRQRRLWNPYRETEQFYVDGQARVQVAAGDYRLRATRGPEYRVVETQVRVDPGDRRRVRLEPRRWIDLPAEGWFSADDHLHIPRPHPGADDAIAAWMAAEDLHVANLLQMGLARDVHVAPQHGFGQTASHRRGRTLLVSGQENPRTHMLGHAIVLGAPHWIDFPGDYLDYPMVWAEAREHGAATGYAHFGLGGAGKGLALWGGTGLLDFLEVENFGFPHYRRWYEALNLGIPLAPTAGTDYPCVPGIPGRDRFYARVGDIFELDTWLEAVRGGRTFVTNGPVVEFSVDDVGMGGEIDLPAPGRVRIRGRVRFDPRRDDIERLELVEKGTVVHVVENVSVDVAGIEQIVLEAERPVGESTWFAVRARGVKMDEIRPPGLEALPAALGFLPTRPGAEPTLLELPGTPTAPVAAAHSAPVWVVVEGSPTLREQAEGRAAAATWASELDDLEHWLSHSVLPRVAGFPGRGDGVPEPLLRRHRSALLEALEEGRAWLTSPPGSQ